MKPKSSSSKKPAEQVVKDIRRKTRRHFSAEDKIRIVLVHEADPAKGGCDFGAFFGITPQGLIDEGIYKEIAIALHTPPHRAISLALAAQALGATKDAARLAARRGRARSCRWHAHRAPARRAEPPTCPC